MICDVVHVERSVYNQLVQDSKRFHETSLEDARALCKKQREGRKNRAAWKKAVARGKESPTGK